MNNKPIITVKEARRYLGTTAKGLDDVEVMQVVNGLHELAKEHIRKKSIKKSNNRLGFNDGLSKPKSE